MLADEPLPARRLADVVGLVDAAEARKLIERLKTIYDLDDSAFQVEEIAGGYQLLSRARYHSWLARLKRTGHELRLTPAALETLAVIAYKQPIMRADVEKVRGVACGELIRHLMEKGLVRVTGRHDSLAGRNFMGQARNSSRHLASIPSRIFPKWNPSSPEIRTSVAQPSPRRGN
jgi:segregation and condensation protein B